MPLLMLKKSRPGQLVRHARDESGNPQRRYEFEPGGVLEVHDADVVPVFGEDILNGVLIPVNFENYKPVPIEFNRDEFAGKLAAHRAELKSKALAPKPTKAKPAPQVDANSDYANGNGTTDAPAEPKAGKSRSRRAADKPTEANTEAPAEPKAGEGNNDATE